MTQCCMGQDCPSVLLYMMHSNNNNNNIALDDIQRCLGVSTFEYSWPRRVGIHPVSVPPQALPSSHLPLALHSHV